MAFPQTKRYIFHFQPSNTSLTPAFAFAKRVDTGASVSTPAISELAGAGNGQGYYYFDWTFATSADPDVDFVINGNAPGAITGLLTAEGTVSVNDLTVPAAISTTHRYSFHYGTTNTSLTPAFALLKRVDTGANLSQPTIFELGGAGNGEGWYYFDWTFGTNADPDVAFLINGNAPGGITAQFTTYGTITVQDSPAAAAAASPGVTTLASIMLQAKQRADMVNSGFISDSEWTSMINGSYQELYGLIVQKFGPSHYYFNTYDFTTTANTELYALPTDMFKLIGVDLQYVSGQPQSYIRLPSFNMTERDRWSFLYGWTNVFPWTNLHYAIRGSNLWLKPIPQAGQNLRIYYYPRLTTLVNPTDAVDGVNGWEQYIIVDAARKALQKEESNAQDLLLEKAALVERLEAEAENRDAGSPARIADVNRGSTISDGMGGGPGGGWY